MQIKRVEKVNEETGELELQMLLTKEQTQVLIEYALSSLVAMGLVQYVSEQEAAATAAKEQEIQTKPVCH